MPAKTYNELIIQYSNEDGFLHYANEAEGAALDPSLDRKAAFEGFESGDVQILRFLNSLTNDHVLTADANEIAVLLIGAVTKQSILLFLIKSMP